MDRTGMPLSSITSKLQEAQHRGLMVLDHQSARPSAQGFDFLSDLQALFLEES